MGCMTSPVTTCHCTHEHKNITIFFYTCPLGLKVKFWKKNIELILQRRTERYKSFPWIRDSPLVMTVTARLFRTGPIGTKAGPFPHQNHQAIQVPTVNGGPRQQFPKQIHQVIQSTVNGGQGKSSSFPNKTIRPFSILSFNRARSRPSNSQTNSSGHSKYC